VTGYSGAFQIWPRPGAGAFFALGFVLGVVLGAIEGSRTFESVLVRKAYLSTFGAKRTCRDCGRVDRPSQLTRLAHARTAFAAVHSPNRPKKLALGTQMPHGFARLRCRIAKPAGSGAHFQLSLDGPGNEGPLGGN
jgi:hypothetical protein